mmetsp:Transcript_50074/g.112546  ORF Transcript_50074/g.112546 Transcript_50074/m.112546 type:complete len:140 (+) Transcript_50074:1628-2047(+)
MAGRRIDTARVRSCSAAMKGQIKKTKPAGVTNVPKLAANWAFVVGPTFRVMTEASVAIMGMCAFGSCMVELTSPKYASEAAADAWFARRTTRDTTTVSARGVLIRTITRQPYGRIIGKGATRSADADTMESSNTQRNIE